MFISSLKHDTVPRVNNLYVPQNLCSQLTLSTLLIKPNFCIPPKYSQFPWQKNILPTDLTCDLTCNLTWPVTFVLDPPHINSFEGSNFCVSRPTNAVPQFVSTLNPLDQKNDVLTTSTSVHFYTVKSTQTRFFCVVKPALVYSNLIECVRSCDQRPYLHNETKRGICIKIEFNPQKNISLLQDGCCFRCLLLQHACCDVMWTHSIILSGVISEEFVYFWKPGWLFNTLYDTFLGDFWGCLFLEAWLAIYMT